jgi:hypothetical protein
MARQVIDDHPDDRRRAERHRSDADPENHCDQQERGAPGQGRAQRYPPPDRSRPGCGAGHRWWGHPTNRPSFEGHFATQRRRPGSPPLRGTTVAGQRRDLTGLRWHCITAILDRGSVNVRFPRAPRQALGEPGGYWPSRRAAMDSLARR